MKKRHKPRPVPYRAVPVYSQKFRGSIFTVLCNFAVLLVYGIFLKLSVDGTLALILFLVMAALQMVICVVIGLTYNSKMWLISAIVIFLVGSGVALYSSI